MPEPTTDHTPSAAWVNPLVLEAERAHEREADLRQRTQSLVACAEMAISDLARAQSWLNKDGADDLMAYRAIQDACARLRRGLAVATGGTP